eukprot:6747731-Karenia_brevis.AAC.1
MEAINMWIGLKTRFFPKNDRTQIYAHLCTYHRDIQKIFPDLGGYPKPLTGPGSDVTYGPSPRLLYRHQGCATPAEVKRAGRQAHVKYHPDKVIAPMKQQGVEVTPDLHRMITDRYIWIQNAITILSDPSM